MSSRRSDDLWPDVESAEGYVAADSSYEESLSYRNFCGGRVLVVLSIRRKKVAEYRQTQVRHGRKVDERDQLGRATRNRMNNSSSNSLFSTDNDGGCGLLSMDQGAKSRQTRPVFDSALVPNKHKIDRSLPSLPPPFALSSWHKILEIAILHVGI